MSKCHECDKKVDSLIPFKCKHCGNLFCKDHYLPENHNCPDFKPKSIFSRLSGTVISEEPDYIDYELTPNIEPDEAKEEEESIEEKPDRLPKKEKSVKVKPTKKRRRKRKYTLWQIINYKCRKATIPVWFLITLIIMITIAVIHQFYIIKILSYDISIIYYICEVIVIGYLMFRLLKKFDNIHVGSDLRLFGLRMLSGLISFIGILIFFFMMIAPFFALFDENMAFVVLFGSSFHLPLTGTILFGTIGVGMSIIGAYLYFKFQRRTGEFVWFGRIR